VQREHGGDAKRTYVAGYSNGAIYAMEVGLRYPHVFFAILCIGGGCNLPEIPKDARHVGAYIIHGTADRSVPYDAAVRARDRLKEAGLEVVFRKKEGKGHVLFEEEAGDFYDWVKKFKRPYTPGSLPWPSDYAKALKKAADEDKLVWVYFYSDKDKTNETAEYLECELLRDPDVVEAGKGYVLVKVDLAKSEVARKEKIRRGCLCVMDSGGSIRKKFSRRIEPKRFLKALKRVKKK
jgi:hypothetical protein